MAAMQERSEDSPDQAPAEGERFSLANRAKSFGYAFAGIGLVVRSQHNAWIHCLATALVVGLGLFFPISGLEWCGLILSIALVWIAEAMNTALESLADALSPQQNPLVGQAKDAAAAAVLLAAIAAAAVGLVILGPYCLKFLGI
jgi:diacylglycerol kinase (ATP)